MGLCGPSLYPPPSRLPPQLSCDDDNDDKDVTENYDDGDDVDNDDDEDDDDGDDDTKSENLIQVAD